VAELTVFHYLHKNTPLHRMDGRIKLLCLILLSLATGFASTWRDYTLLTATLLSALLVAQLPLAAIFKELKYFSFLITLVVVVHSFSIPGTPLPRCPVPGATVEGLTSGLLFSWRLVLFVTLCVLLTGTTPISSLTNAVEWFLRPIPFIPASRVATMINLTFLLIPLLFDAAAEIAAAQQARCIARNKSPLRRILFTAYPLLVQTIRRAEELALAMEARCYSEERTRAVFAAAPGDRLLLAATLLVFSLVFFIR
jgi:energy-coupling factor transporter transmembrane protein EcfT